MPVNDSSDDRRLEALPDRLVNVGEKLGELGAKVEVGHDKQAELRRRQAELERDLDERAEGIQAHVRRIETSLSWWKTLAGVAAVLGITGGSIGVWANHQLDTVEIASNAGDAVTEALAASPVHYVFVAAAAVYLDTGVNVTKDQDVVRQRQRGL